MSTTREKKGVERIFMSLFFFIFQYNPNNCFFLIYIPFFSRSIPRTTSHYLTSFLKALDDYSRQIGSLVVVGIPYSTTWLII